MRRTKIVATIGPSTDTPEAIAQLIDAGMDVARLNFSHGSHEEHARRIRMLREVAEQKGSPLTILQDLQGPKIRTGTLVGGIPVKLLAGQRFVITMQPMIGTAERVSTTYTALARDVVPGDRILLSDGLIELRVVSAQGDEVATEVVYGGELREKQGINLPGVNVSAPALTEKDAEDLAFGLEQNVDIVALSFVRRPSDIEDIKRRIKQAGKTTPVMAKIEKPEALEDIAGIMDAVDAIMVARGDLGVEVPAERVPMIQKQLIEAASDAGVPVVTATQMLDSMIRNPRPTRAEVSDVANAIIDGTDAVMLSGETANGAFPFESVRMMAKIAEEAEESGRHSARMAPARVREQRELPRAMAAAAVAIVAGLPIKAIVAFTNSGSTARLVSRLRPDVPIFGFTPSEETYHRLNLAWGVTPVRCAYVDRLDDLGDVVSKQLIARGAAKPGDMVVMTGGHPIAQQGQTNFVKVMEVS